MLRPHWDTAPEWAHWMAMDGDGDWFWYENKPVFVLTWEPKCWARADRCSRMEFAGENTSDAADNEQAEQSLQRRPHAKPKWCDAPPWAQWLAMDGDGGWFWYSTQPHSTPGFTGEDGEDFPLAWYPDGVHALVEFAGFEDEDAVVVADEVAAACLEQRP